MTRDSAATGLAAVSVPIAAVVLLLAQAGPSLALESRAQQACLVAVNKAFASLTKVEGKEAAACIKALAGGSPSQPSVASCVAADAKGKIASARDKATAAIQKACSEAPDFGSSDLSGATTLAGASGVRTQLLARIFGDGIDAAIATKSGDAKGAACQAAVVKALDRCWSARIAAYSSCAADGLETSIDDADGLGACRDSDPDGKVAAACSGAIASVLEKKCAAVDLALRLPGCECQYTADCLRISATNAANRALTSAANLSPAATVLPYARTPQFPMSEPWVSPVYGSYVASRVVGREEDAPLACPLGAVNIYTVQDAAADTAYNNGILPLLLEQGIRVLFAPDTPIDVLGDSPAELVQGEQAMPLYGDAKDFLKLATRREVFPLAPYKAAQVGDTLHFGFEHCLHDCEALYAATFPPFVFGSRLLIHHFSADRATIEGVVPQLASEAAMTPGLRLRWVGRAVADFHFELPDGSDVQAFHALPADGSLVYELDPDVDPASVLALPVLSSFMAETTSDAVVLLE